MRITKIVTRRHKFGTFFFTVGMEFGICRNFVDQFFPSSLSVSENVKLTFSTTNPKKKGFEKVQRIRHTFITMNNIEFNVCYTEKIALDNAGVKDGEFFWIKIEKL